MMGMTLSIMTGFFAAEPALAKPYLRFSCVTS